MTETAGSGVGLTTPRLRVTAMTRDALQAWVEGDVHRLAEETGAVFGEPLAAPPLFREDLPRFRDRMTETPDELGWWVWLISSSETRRALGVCGLGGRPGGDGVAVLGYAVYPECEGNGYATEASGAVVAWALAQPGVTAVRATVPSTNVRSVAVARKLGMVQVGEDVHPDVGDIAVYQIARSA